MRLYHSVHQFGHKPVGLRKGSLQNCPLVDQPGYPRHIDKCQGQNLFFLFLHNLKRRSRILATGTPSFGKFCLPAIGLDYNGRLRKQGLRFEGVLQLCLGIVELLFPGRSIRNYL